MWSKTAITKTRNNAVLKQCCFETMIKSVVPLRSIHSPFLIGTEDLKCASKIVIKEIWITSFRYWGELGIWSCGMASKDLYWRPNWFGIEDWLFVAVSIQQLILIQGVDQTRNSNLIYLVRQPAKNQFINAALYISFKAE